MKQSVTRRVVMIVSVATLLGAASAASAQSRRTPDRDASAVDAEVVDTLPFFLNTRGRALIGSHALSQTTDANRAYYVKWAADSFETYVYDDEFIYLREDHSGAPVPGSYTFSNGQWMSRSMAVGETLSVKDNFAQNFSIDGGDCRPTGRRFFPYVNVLEAHLPRYDLGGSMGVQDVIVLRYDYRNGVGSEYEKMYYARGLGLVKWELYRDDTLLQTSIFNDYLAEPPVAPDLRSECIGTPVPLSRELPAVPKSAPEFVHMLYSCVLDVDEPDQGGFQFWLNHLTAGTAKVQDIYADFFRYQSSTLSNDQFARKLYGCILYRTPDPDGYNNVLAALSSGTPRAQLVQSVLASDEFTVIVLPRILEALDFQRLVNVNSYKCMAVPGGSRASGTGLFQWQCGPWNDHFWRIETLSTAPGSPFRIRNYNSGMCLAVPAATLAPGAQVMQWPCGDYADHKWMFETSSGLGTRVRRSNTNLCLAVDRGSGSNGAKLIQWPCGTYRDHHWHLADP